MSLDQFGFTPPDLDDLAHAVELAQRLANRRFFGYVRGEAFPSSIDFRTEVGALRHLTAIHRTLRKIAGPLFDPASPMPPFKRYVLMERRMREVEAAFEASRAPAEPGTPPPPEPQDVFLPPPLENLVGAVNHAQQFCVIRLQGYLDGVRPLESGDYRLEIEALRDLAAINRTLRRMSGLTLAEDETLPEADLGPDVNDEDYAALRAAALAEGEAERLRDAELHPDVTPVARLSDPTPPPAAPPSPLRASVSPCEPSSSSPDTADIENPIPVDAPLPPHAPLRLVAPVPEIRTVSPSTCGRRSAPLGSRDRGRPRDFDAPADPRRAPDTWPRETPEDLLEDDGPWGNYSTPPPPWHKSVDEVNDEIYGPDPSGFAPRPRPKPELDPFWRAAGYGSPQSRPTSDPPRFGSPRPILNDSDPPSPNSS